MLKISRKGIGATNDNHSDPLTGFIPAELIHFFATKNP
jgi:hypothetical protein